ncbi:CopG family transcriptional regulator [Sphingobium boeckii]|uniref:Putative transcriptional regulator n=1 Tax=Sphingobium boeckii TaxID=1082345 RepID=A0A7W9EDC5_9SPHN|nr:CopG family transcriptional regulator [Sphingobium boeckii]MBB5684977.1 putative transcriptional regulator [Sphingobium boeckii]
MKPRHHLYLDVALTTELEALVRSRPKLTKSAVVADALRSYLKYGARHEVDELLRKRLDRMTAETAGVRRDLHALSEALALFIRHELTVQAPIAEGDEAARAMGRARFNQFVLQVGRNLANDRLSLGGGEGEGA